MPEVTPKRLGRGLSALLNQPVSVEIAAAKKASSGDEQPASMIQMLLLSAITPSPFQPRRVWDESTLAGLAMSIKQAGIMQPILVRRSGEGYQLIAGERRWRAAKIAGLETIPAIVRELPDSEAAEWALVENIQREDLNAMDRAFGLRSLSDKFLLSHQLLAERVGLDRSTVANLIRLTELEAPIADFVRRDVLSAGHARALLAVPAGARRIELAKLAAEQGWSVRRIEAAAKAENDTEHRVLQATNEAAPAAGEDARFAVLRDLERRLSQQLGTKVQLRTDKAGARGAMHIEFYSLDHFDGLIRRMGLTS
jgi:ParB family transcriptional regulator, chromosome partitioning protein